MDTGGGRLVASRTTSAKTTDMERMNTSTRRLLGGLATAAVLLLGQGGFVRAADPSATPIPAPPSGPTGNEMLSVQPSLISISAKPGATTSTELTVRSAANLSVKIKAQGLGQSRDGNFVAIPPDSDTGAFSARPMITATPENLDLKPGDAVKVTVNVTLPTDAGEGTRYAILSITGFPPTPTGSSNVGFGVDLGVSTIVQIANTAQTRTAAIDGIDVGKSLPGQALPVAVAFKNTGNTHFGAIPNELLATAVLQDASGTELATATADGNQLSIIPGFERTMPLAMTPSKPLVDGATYHIEVGVGLKDGTIFDRKALDFTWSGGEVLSPTSGAIATPPASAPAAPTTDTGLILAAALIGAGLVALLFLVVPRTRRRKSPDGGDAAK
jgi:hypothetical protein